MRGIERASIPLAAIAVVLYAAAMAGPAQEQEGQPPVSMQGELLQIDTDNQIIVVQTPAETPMAFRYTDQTEVSGVEGTVAGLATTADAKLTVHYTERDGVRTASKIERLGGA